MSVSADDILKLLAAKHSHDVFVTECKTGPSPSLKLDAWTMNRSWVNHCCTGYEIKVARSDFLRDDKWSAYLQYCHCFYFVSPPGVVERNEVPEGVGLLWTSTNAKRLYTKRKAPRREVDVPAELLIYLLMARTHIVRHGPSSGGETGYWQTWLATKDENKTLGWNVSRKIRELVVERIDRVDRENKHLRSENERLAEAKDLCKRLGVDVSWCVSADSIRRAQLTALGDGALRQVRTTRQTLERLEKEIGEQLATVEPTS